MSSSHPQRGAASNPRQSKKLFVVFTSIFTVMNSTVSSGLASNSAPYFAREFGITSHELLVLPTSIFLVGYCVGPVVFGPMSEQYGRKNIMLYAFVFYTLFTMAVALAPNYASLVVFRFLEGIGAACPITVVGGSVLSWRHWRSLLLTLRTEHVPISTITLNHVAEPWCVKSGKKLLSRPCLSRLQCTGFFEQSSIRMMDEAQMTAPGQSDSPHLLGMLCCSFLPERFRQSSWVLQHSGPAPALPYPVTSHPYPGGGASGSASSSPA